MKVLLCETKNPKTDGLWESLKPEIRKNKKSKETQAVYIIMQQDFDLSQGTLPLCCCCSTSDSDCCYTFIHSMVRHLSVVLFPFA